MTAAGQISPSSSKQSTVFYAIRTPRRDCIVHTHIYIYIYMYSSTLDVEGKRAMTCMAKRGSKGRGRAIALECYDPLWAPPFASIDNRLGTSL